MRRLWPPVLMNTRNYSLLNKLRRSCWWSISHISTSTQSQKVNLSVFNYFGKRISSSEEITSETTSSEITENLINFDDDDVAESSMNNLVQVEKEDAKDNSEAGEPVKYHDYSIKGSKGLICGVSHRCCSSVHVNGVNHKNKARCAPSPPPP